MKEEKFDNLADCRKAIDEVDKEILSLFKRRMFLAENVAEIKKNTSSPLYDPEREKAILDGVAEGADGDGQVYARKLFSFLMDASRAVQKKILFSGREKKKKSNCVLIGMPGCGKSTIGRIIGKKAGMKVVDIDDLVTQRTGMTPEKMITTLGEAAFREAEHQAVLAAAMLENCVIVTGGGTVTDTRNVAALAETGRIYFIRRKLEELSLGNGRPLSPDFEAVKRLAQLRLPLYSEACDAVVDNPSDKAEKTSEEIFEDWKKFASLQA